MHFTKEETRVQRNERAGSGMRSQKIGTKLCLKRRQRVKLGNFRRAIFHHPKYSGRPEDMGVTPERHGGGIKALCCPFPSHRVRWTGSGCLEIL